MTPALVVTFQDAADRIEPELAEARRRDVPVLVSAGYAACHWCHG